MALAISVTGVEDLVRENNFYDGTAVVEIDSDYGQLTLNIPFEHKPTIDDGIRDALMQVKAFGLAIQQAIAG